MNEPPYIMSALIRTKASSEAKVTVTYPNYGSNIELNKITLNFNVMTLKFSI